MGYNFSVGGRSAHDDNAAWNPTIARGRARLVSGKTATTLRPNGPRRIRRNRSTHRKTPAISDERPRRRPRHIRSSRARIRQKKARRPDKTFERTKETKIIVCERDETIPMLNIIILCGSHTPKSRVVWEQLSADGCTTMV